MHISTLSENGVDSIVDSERFYVHVSEVHSEETYDNQYIPDF